MRGENFGSLFMQFSYPKSFMISTAEDNSPSEDTSIRAFWTTAFPPQVYQEYGSTRTRLDSTIKKSRQTQVADNSEEVSQCTWDLPILCFPTKRGIKLIRCRTKDETDTLRRLKFRFWQGVFILHSEPHSICTWMFCHFYQWLYVLSIIWKMSKSAVVVSNDERCSHADVCTSS